VATDYDVVVLGGGSAGTAAAQAAHAAGARTALINDGEILGSQILGPRADDLAHLITVLMYHHSRVDDILQMPWYHPTLSEVMLDLARDMRARL